MNIIIKKMETAEEIKGKAYVHWCSWHEAYPDLVDPAYLEKLTLEKCEDLAFKWPHNQLIAKDKDRVIGFVGYGEEGKGTPETGEIFALYVLREYYGKGAAQQLMKAGLEQLDHYSQICLWVLKDNNRAIRFYQKCGFKPDGEEMNNPVIKATEIRMDLTK